MQNIDVGFAIGPADKNWYIPKAGKNKGIDVKNTKMKKTILRISNYVSDSETVRHEVLIN